MATNHNASVSGPPAEITGGWSTKTMACTTSAATTDTVCILGKAFGTVRNESGASVTITYYAAAEDGGTALALQDADGVAVTQTVADDVEAALPAAIAGVAYLVPVISTGVASSLVFHFER